MSSHQAADDAITVIDRIALKIIDAISLVLIIIAGIALMLMMVQVSADVVGKFVFTAPVPVTLEIVSYYYMVAVVFLPLAAVERMNGNIHVELIYARLGRAAKRVLDIISYLLFIWLIWLITTGTWTVALKKHKVGEFIMGSYPVVIWPTRYMVPIGCGLLLVLLVVKLYRAVVMLFRPDLDNTEAVSDEPTDYVKGTSL
ncbi:TRAP transporter small permease subunit [Oceanicola sp. 22II-s10i]|uniref:TRAP transporter small permease subunit n=1 Tax=Oceanicola sp. 22II-s10i TaxID=1317116 RepID=UPI0015960D6E|nr:TRAP transporter small permease subunit [Oceanicola sp. 22II-s10i]